MAGESESWPTQNQNQNRNQKKKKNMIQYPIAAYHIALCHVHIYRLDTSETFSFFKEPGRGRKEGEGEKEGEKDDLFLSMMSDLSVWSP